MIGRGTRLCPDLFGPGDDKEFFYIFDFCQNLEFFSQNLPATEGYVADSLAKRLFNGRLGLIAELDEREAARAEPRAAEQHVAPAGHPESNADVRAQVAAVLHKEVAAMNLDNFIIRPHRRVIEKYAKPDAWRSLTPEALSELSHEVAGLPSALDPEGEEAKRFDLLALNLQLALLRSEPVFVRLRDRIKAIAGLLEEKAAIPMVREQMSLIQDVQTDEWWEGVTVPMLEVMRRRLRGLVHLIDKRQRQPVYTDFEDVIGEGINRILPGFDGGTGLDRFRSKVEAKLAELLKIEAVRKIHDNEPITTDDLSAVEPPLSTLASAPLRTFRQPPRTPPGWACSSARWSRT